MKYVSFILLIADSSEFHFSFFHFVLYFFMTKQTGFCRSVLFLLYAVFLFADSGDNALYRRVEGDYDDADGGAVGYEHQQSYKHDVFLPDIFNAL